MAGPVWLAAVCGFVVGASIIRLGARIRTARLAARVEAAEFEAAQLREQLSSLSGRGEAAAPADLLHRSARTS